MIIVKISYYNLNRPFEWKGEGKFKALTCLQSVVFHDLACYLWFWSSSHTLRGIWRASRQHEFSCGFVDSASHWMLYRNLGAHICRAESHSVGGDEHWGEASAKKFCCTHDVDKHTWPPHPDFLRMLIGSRHFRAPQSSHWCHTIYRSTGLQCLVWF